MTDTDDTSTAETSRLERIPWRRILNVVGLIVLIAVVVPFLVYAVPQAVSADHSYVVLSGSMEPTMSPGDVIIVNDVDASQIQKGDIITFGAPTPTTHRVIEVREQDGTRTFVTKGDANEDADQTSVTPDQVQGKVMSVGGQPLVIPYIGYIIRFASTQMGIVVFLVIPLVLLVVSEIWNVLSDKRTGADGDAETSDVSATEATEEGAVATEEGTEATGEGPVATEEAIDGEHVGTTAGEPEESDDAMTFTAAELQLGLVTLGAFLAYSIWVAYATEEIWSFGVAGSVAAAFLLLLGFYVTGGGTGGESQEVTREQISATDGGTATPEESSEELSPATDPESPDESAPGDADTEAGETND